MIIEYPEFLPKPLISSKLTKEDYFKKTENFEYNFDTERIIKNFDSVMLNFDFCKEDYIKFEDFYVDDLQEGLFNLKIESFDGKGNVKKITGDILGGLDVKVYPTYFSVSCLFVLKKI